MSAAATTLPAAAKAQAQAQDVPEELWNEAALLPCTLAVEVPLKEFTVRDLLRLEAGAVVESRNLTSADVPVLVNARLVGWAEFEVAGTRVAIRLTELA